MKYCKKCALPLSSDEIGLYLKLVDRNGTDGLCMNCLSEHLKLPVDDLYAMADRFRKAGCVLFPPKTECM